MIPNQRIAHVKVLMFVLSIRLQTHRMYSCEETMTYTSDFYIPHDTHLSLIFFFFSVDVLIDIMVLP